MTVIKFRKEFYQQIKDGVKTQTLRTPQHRLEVVPGDFAACVFPGTKEQLFVTIIDVGYKYFKTLNDEDARLEGFDSVNELKKVLLDIYPTLDNHNRLYYYRFRLDGYTETVKED